MKKIGDLRAELASLKQYSPYYTVPQDLTPALEACLELAADAHEGQKRKKPEQYDIPYITHPIMTYHVLKECGISGETSLCASFLHDVMEDCQPFLCDAWKKLTDEKKAERGDAKAEEEGYVVLASDVPGQLQPKRSQVLLEMLIRDRLEKKFAKVDGISTLITRDTGAYAYKIARMVEEVSNTFKGEGKREKSTAHFNATSDRAQRIKLADQIASKIDDLIIPSHQTPEQIREQVLTLRNIAEIAADSGSISAQMLEKLATHVNKLVLGREPEDTSSIPFSLEDSMKTAREQVLFENGTEKLSGKLLDQMARLHDPATREKLVAELRILVKDAASQKTNGEQSHPSPNRLKGTLLGAFATVEHSMDKDERTTTRTWLENGAPIYVSKLLKHFPSLKEPEQITSTSKQFDDYGLSSVYVDCKNNVTAYEMRIQAREGRDAFANVLSTELRKAIEHPALKEPDMESQTLVSSGSSTGNDGRLYRIYELTRPMPLQQFIDIASQPQMVKDSKQVRPLSITFAYKLQQQLNPTPVVTDNNSVGKLVDTKSIKR